VVTIDNPPANVLDDATLLALRAVAQEIAAADGIRAVVLTGAGDRVYVAGADLRHFQLIMGDADAMGYHASLTRSAFDALAQLPQPLIAAAVGAAVGGGCELLLLCDLIVADPGARFGLPEVTLGLIPGAGGTQRLPRRVSPSLALELLLTGDIIDAARAREIGLVNVISAPGNAREEASALAARLAQLPAQAVRAAKQAARTSLDEGLERGLDVERELFLGLAGSPGAKEGVEAFLQRRRPHQAHA
jgi:enoyl-CoA hydratase/carnithine racemase